MPEWNGKADIMRWEILQHYGGIVVDADSVCVVPLDDSFLAHHAFASYEHETLRRGLVAAGTVGAEPGVPFLEEILRAIETRELKGRAWESVGPKLLTEFAHDLYLYPARTFLPTHLSGADAPGNAPVYATQFWGSTNAGDDGDYGGVVVETDRTVSVVIPCFRQAQYLAEAVGSVLGQTYRAHEIIVVTGDDESATEARRLGFTPVLDGGQGLANARNLGVEKATGEFIVALDADDVLGDRYLEKTIRVAGDIVSTNMQYFGDSNDGWDLSPWNPQTISQVNQLCAHSLYARRLWEAVGGYSPAAGHDDWLFWARAAKLQPTVVHVPERLLRYRVHSDQQTGGGREQFPGAMEAIHRLLLGEGTKHDRVAVCRMPEEGYERVQKRLAWFPDHPDVRALAEWVDQPEPPDDWEDLFSQPEEEPEPSSEGIGLCMIVKNEAHVIERCLMSVRPVISHWTIVDTGSTDGTQDIIRKSKILRGVPGELHERPWRDFAANRNDSIELATGKTSHVLVIDADDILELAENFRLPQLNENSYALNVLHGGVTHLRAHVFRPELYKYVGVLHEALWPLVPDQLIQTMRIRIIGGGNRSRDPERFVRDAEIIERALKQEPKGSYLAHRYAFFLAQSWLDAYRVSGSESYLVPALEAYKRRAAMGGDPEEATLALSEASRMQEILDSLRDEGQAARR